VVQEGERIPRYRPPQGALQAAGSRLHAGVRALIVATKPGNAGGAKGCRKVETWQPNMVDRHRQECIATTRHSARKMDSSDAGCEAYGVVRPIGKGVPK
jgi:hypothetical protein